MTRITLTHLLSIAAAAMLLASATVSRAAPITVPTILNPGDQYRLAFVTSTTRDATSSNIADYNAFVTAAANAVPELAALGTTWTAIVSTDTVDARDNTNTNPLVEEGDPIFLLNDSRLVTDNADLWDGRIYWPLDIDEFGDEQTTFVWTGTDPSGIAQELYYIGNPTPYTYIGYSYASSWGWVEYGVFDPSNRLPLYALSATMTVIPEPSTALLLVLGLVGIAAGRRGRGPGGFFSPPAS